MKAILVSIGDEILIGQTVNTNAAWMGEQLNQIGIDVVEIISISDKADHIISTLDHSLAKADLIFMTGGLGPTKDDITKETLAKYFGKKMSVHPKLLAMLEAYFEKRERELTEQGKKVAMMPEDTRLFMNYKGTAPAMWFEKDGKITVAMPGVPYEMKRFMTSDILPELQKMGVAQTIVHKTLMCAGVGETVVAEAIKDIEDNLPEHIKLAYLPNLGILRVRLSGIGTDETALRKEVETYAEKISALIYKWHYGYDEMPLEKKLGTMLLERDKRLGLAESCTGGNVAARMVSIPGSSQYFEGGMVVYSNKLKNRQLGVDMALLEGENVPGAVSEETVSAMVKGTIENLEVDYALAISGVAGPGGGSEEKPVGTVWIAAGSKDKIRTKKYQLTDHRDINIQLSTNLALNQLRVFMLTEED